MLDRMYWGRVAMGVVVEDRCAGQADFAHFSHQGPHLHTAIQIKSCNAYIIRSAPSHTVEAFLFTGVLQGC